MNAPSKRIRESIGDGLSRYHTILNNKTDDETKKKIFNSIRKGDFDEFKKLMKKVDMDTLQEVFKEVISSSSLEFFDHLICNYPHSPKNFVGFQNNGVGLTMIDRALKRGKNIEYFRTEYEQTKCVKINRYLISRGLKI